ncbi:MAG: cytochrome d ubiquinol oxidase subunit II, partial [Alphaproteobacteria bacterium]|nr:cytochrome d ubiquinol oxidase subunit II [Alphaproteobacteria bacterium]
AFEYRWRTERWKKVWDIAFFGGSTVAALCQGIALGALVQGIAVTDRHYSGGWWDWLTPFSMLTGIAVVIGYALLGATWIMMKTDGAVHHRMRDLAKPLAIVTLVFIALVSVWTPFQNPIYFERWFTMPGMLITLPVPLFMAFAVYKLFHGIANGRDVAPFLASMALFVISFIGIGISFYPMMVPPSLTIWDVAAPDSSLKFALVGTVVLVPLILGYTAYAYWVFRGKLDPEAGYH